MKTFKLNDNPKIKTGFITPDNYFDDFSDKLMLQLSEKEVKVIPLFSRKKVISIAVAAVVFFVFMIPIINNYRQKSEILDTETLETYLSYQANINQYDLIRDLDTNAIKNLNKSITLENGTLEDILSSNPNIEQYILE